MGLAKVSDSAAGLVVNGPMVMVDPAAQRAHAHLKAGSIKGLSIGYTLPPESTGKTTYNADGTRTIREVKLFEMSLVTIPADPRAMVASLKSLSQVDQLLRSLKGGDVDAETLASLRSIDTTLKALLGKDAPSCDCECLFCASGDCANCDDPACDDPNCIGTMSAKTATEELAVLKSFAAELKRMAYPKRKSLTYAAPRSRLCTTSIT